LQKDVLQRAAIRACAQFIERAFGDQAPVLDDADALRHPFGHFQDVRGENDGTAALHMVQQQILDLACGGSIQAGQRLVENQ